ncbi:MAG: hypothetical protein ABH986_01190 [archaeon]
MPRFQKRRKPVSGFRRRLTGKSFSAKAKDSSGENSLRKGKPSSNAPKKTGEPKTRGEPDWMSPNPSQEVLNQAIAKKLKFNSLGDAMKQLGFLRDKALQIFVGKFMADGATEERAKEQAKIAMRQQFYKK